MLPARRGSIRLKQKNLALLNGKPLISYVIEAAKQSGVFERIVLNSEDKIFDKDRDKQKYAESRGYLVLRFWNNEVDQNIEGVLEVIKQACKI